MAKRKIDAMHERFGKCGGLLCRDCNHLVHRQWGDRKFYKCELYGLSHGEATDWRISYTACGMYDMPYDAARVTETVLEQILHEPKKKNEPLEGQIRLEW